MITRGDKVRVSYYKERASTRELICVKVGEVVMTFRTDVFVKYPDSHVVEKVPMKDCEKV